MEVVVLLFTGKDMLEATEDADSIHFLATYIARLPRFPTIPQRSFLQTHYSPVRVLLYMRSEARVGIPAGGRR